MTWTKNVSFDGGVNMKRLVIENKLATIGYYHIHVFDGNEYTGNGAFCRDLQEVADYMNRNGITEYKYI